MVTGTLLDGHLSLGDEIEILPGGLRGRVRSLQTHKMKENTAVPGSRTAVNISGVELDQVNRGEVLSLPGRYHASQRLDVHFRLLADASAPLRHSSEVKFFVGAAEVVARTRLLGVEELKPGEEGWLQLELAAPVVVVRGDRYIVRRPSPAETLGGGAVVDPHPARRHKRFDPALLDRLEALRQGSPADVLLQAGLALGAAPLRNLVVRSRLDQDAVGAALEELLAEGLLVQLESGNLLPNSDLLVIPSSLWETLTRRAKDELEQYHKAFPLRRGMPREELKSRLKSSPRLFNATLRLWISGGNLVENGKLLARPAHRVEFSPAQKARADHLLEQFAGAPYATPSVKECQAEVGEEVYSALVEMERLVQVSQEVVFRAEDYQEMVTAVTSHLEREGTLTLAQFRDRFNTSRKYAQAFLEHLDAVGVTQRSGDLRVLRKPR